MGHMDTLVWLTCILNKKLQFMLWVSQAPKSNSNRTPKQPQTLTFYGDNTVLYGFGHRLVPVKVCEHVNVLMCLVLMSLRPLHVWFEGQFTGQRLTGTGWNFSLSFGTAVRSRHRFLANPAKSHTND
jgi:hypothetical protein